ncbi:uncharacterized protein DS421_19g643490 [Arachis hypogaea]|uniref:Aminotransferase-like plant mobile domain-containing protein n=1 Tax=Arachis hypogaea TaxID=3818 RepID=A0A6B9V6U1_ARAHY|nr:uncharacterized protein DS421_19g643490 [Arachis hypogaea]
MEEQLLGYESEMYRLDHAEHIAGRLDKAPRVLCTRRNLMAQPPEQIKPYLRRVGFEWRPESHTFHLPCGEMTITLQYVAYQLGLRIDSDPVSGCIGGWEQHHQGRMIEEICEQLLGVVLGPDDRRYRGAPDEVHIRWLPLLEDLERCGRLLWGSAVLAWLYRQMCWATKHGQCNLGGCVSLLLSWAYHRIPLIRPDGFDTRRFSLLESTDRTMPRARAGLGITDVEWTPYADPQLIGIVPPAIAEAEASSAVVCPLLCFAIVEWHQVDRVVRQFDGLQHIPTRPLNIDDMHRLDGRFGRGEWFPQLLDRWHELWDARLFSLGDQHLMAAGVVPKDLPTHHPLALDLHQPDDGHLLEMRPAVGGERGRGRGRARGRGRRGAGRRRQGGEEALHREDVLRNHLRIQLTMVLSHRSLHARMSLLVSPNLPLFLLPAI